MAFEGLFENYKKHFEIYEVGRCKREGHRCGDARGRRWFLPEADVNFKVVKQFVATIKEKADVLKSLTPGQAH